MQDKPLVIGKFQTPNCVPHTIFKLVIEKPFCVTSEWYLWHCYCLSFIACKPFPAFIVFPFYVCIAAQWVKKVLWINHERMASSLLCCRHFTIRYAAYLKRGKESFQLEPIIERDWTWARRHPFTVKALTLIRRALASDFTKSNSNTLIYIGSIRSWHEWFLKKNQYIFSLPSFHRAHAHPKHW